MRETVVNDEDSVSDRLFQHEPVLSGIHAVRSRTTPENNIPLLAPHRAHYIYILLHPHSNDTSLLVSRHQLLSRGLTGREKTCQIATVRRKGGGGKDRRSGNNMRVYVGLAPPAILTQTTRHRRLRFQLEISLSCNGHVPYPSNFFFSEYKNMCIYICEQTKKAIIQIKINIKIHISLSTHNKGKTKIQLCCRRR